MAFNENLKEGVKYYQNLFGNLKSSFQDTKEQILKDLEYNQNLIQDLKQELKRKLTSD